MIRAVEMKGAFIVSIISICVIGIATHGIPNNGPKKSAETSLMAEQTFDTFFPIAVARRGMSYVAAKSAILALQNRERENARRRLEPLTQDASNWEQQLTALILFGWLERNDAFVQVSVYMRGDLSGPEPLGGFGVKHRAQAIAKLGTDVTPRVLEMLYKNREYADETQSLSLFAALVNLKDDLAVMPMIALIEHPETDAGSRVQALNVLSRMGDTRGLDAVLRVANQPDAASDVREPAIRALAGFDDPQAIDGLFHILNNEARPLPDRVTASNSLKVMCHPDTRERAREAITRLNNVDMKVNLVRLFSCAGDKQDLPYLRGLTSDANAEIARAAREAIEDIELQS